MMCVTEFARTGLPGFPSAACAPSKNGGRMKSDKTKGSTVPDSKQKKNELFDSDDELVDKNLEVEQAKHAWEAVKTGDELETYIEDIADTVRIGLDQSIAILTPWFFNNMPKIYYQTTPRPEKVRHLSAIITGHVFET